MAMTPQGARPTLAPGGTPVGKGTDRDTFDWTWRNITFYAYAGSTQHFDLRVRDGQLYSLTKEHNILFISKEIFRPSARGQSQSQLDWTDGPVDFDFVLWDVCQCPVFMLLSLQNLSLSQLQEAHRRDLLCLPPSSRGQYPGPPAPLSLELVGLKCVFLLTGFSLSTLYRGLNAAKCEGKCIMIVLLFVCFCRFTPPRSSFGKTDSAQRQRSHGQSDWVSSRWWTTEQVRTP